MMKKKIIGILSSGGDAQGMNACIKTVVTTAERNGMEVVAFLGGFQGLLENKSKKLTSVDVDLCFNLGGSIIYAGRSKDFTDEQKRKKAKDVLKQNKVEALIVLGGEGSIRGCLDLKNLGINVIAIPCTIDNDVPCSDRSIGFDTAANNAVDLIDNVQETMKTNRRILLVEVMGRYCGDIALYSGMCSESDIIMIPEKKQSAEKIIREIGKQLKANNDSPTVVVAEHQFDINEIAKKVEATYKKECRAIIAGYYQRGGKPTMQDRLLAMRMGVSAVECVMDGTFGVVTALKDDNIKLISLEKAVKAKRKFREDVWHTFIRLKKYETYKK